VSDFFGIVRSWCVYLQPNFARRLVALRAVFELPLQSTDRTIPLHHYFDLQHLHCAYSAISVDRY
jgi:hypothetical protein